MFINAKPTKLYEYGISPNKIFEYMMKNKSVLNGIDSPNNPMEKSGVEIKFLANSVEDLVLKVLEFKSSRLKNIVDSRLYVINNHSYNMLAVKYSQLFK
jgi:hypothetical protein